MIYGNIFGTRAPKPEIITQPYLAYGLAKPTKVKQRIEIFRYGGDVFVIEEAEHYETLVLDENVISLLFDTCTIELAGLNLLELVDLVQFYAVSFVEVFDPSAHYFPGDEAPLIARIRWKTVLRTETEFIPSPEFHEDAWQISMT